MGSRGRRSSALTADGSAEQTATDGNVSADEGSISTPSLSLAPGAKPFVIASGPMAGRTTV